MSYAVTALAVPILLAVLSSQDVHLPTDGRFGMPFEFAATWGFNGSDQSGPHIESAAPSGAGSYFDSPPARAMQESAAEALSPDGRYAAMAPDYTKAALLDCLSGRVLARVAPSNGRADIESMAVSSSGRLLAVADLHGVALWDSVTAAIRFRIENGGLVRSLAFSPDDKLLAITSEQGDALVTLVGVGRGGLVRSYAGNYGEMVASVQFAPDGSRLFAATVGGSDDTSAIYCWSVATGDLLWRVGKRAWNAHFAISSDCRTVAVGGLELELRDAANGERLPNQLGAGDQVSDMDPLCFSNDGRWLAVTCRGAVRLWRLHAGVDWSFVLPAMQASAAAFSRDSMRLTTLSRTEGVEKWALRDHRRIWRIASVAAQDSLNR